MADLHSITIPEPASITLRIPMGDPDGQTQGELVDTPVHFCEWLRDFWKFESAAVPSFDALVLYGRLADWAKGDRSSPLVIDAVELKLLAASARKPVGRAGYIMHADKLPISWPRAVFDAPKCEATPKTT